MTGTTQQLSIVVVGLPTLLAALPLLWKSASLRGDSNKNWRDRVELCRAALTDRALTTLVELRGAVDELAQPDGRFNPGLARVDPAPLSRLTREFERFIRVRDRLEDRFRLLLGLCGLTPILIGLFIVGDAAALSDSAPWPEPSWIGATGIGVSGVLLLVGLGVVVVYIRVHRFLADAEILAGHLDGSMGEGDV